MAKSSSTAAAEASAMRKKLSVAYDAIGLYRKTFDQTLLLPPLTSKLLNVYVNYIKLYNAYPYDSNAVPCYKPEQSTPIEFTCIWS